MTEREREGDRERGRQESSRCPVGNWGCLSQAGSLGQERSLTTAPGLCKVWCRKGGEAEALRHRGGSQWLGVGTPSTGSRRGWAEWGRGRARAQVSGTECWPHHHIRAHSADCHQADLRGLPDAPPTSCLLTPAARTPQKGA